MLAISCITSMVAPSAFKGDSHQHLYLFPSTNKGNGIPSGPFPFKMSLMWHIENEMILNFIDPLIVPTIKLFPSRRTILANILETKQKPFHISSISDFTQFYIRNFLFKSKIGGEKWPFADVMSETATCFTIMFPLPKRLLLYFFLGGGNTSVFKPNTQLTLVSPEVHTNLGSSFKTLCSRNTGTAHY